VSVRLEIRVSPRSRRTHVKGRRADGALQVAVSAPADGGRANAAVVSLLAEWLGVKPGQVRITRGLAARGKTVEIDGLEREALERRIAELEGASEAGHGE